jgi:hypothetical protein
MLGRMAIDGIKISSNASKHKAIGSVQGSVQSFSHFRSSLELRKVVGFGCFAAGPHGGQQQKRQAMARTSASRFICK